MSTEDDDISKLLANVSEHEKNRVGKIKVFYNPDPVSPCENCSG